MKEAHEWASYHHYPLTDRWYDSSRRWPTNLVAVLGSDWDLGVVREIYEVPYFDSIIETFNNTNADIVGGPTDTIYNGHIQESIAYCYSHIFGMGGGKVHDMKFNGFTNGVTFGAFKKYVFENNFFDEDLIRNQDDEFFSRCNNLGYKIYQSSKIKLFYSPRRNFFALSKQYFQYGYYKPMALKKVKNSFRLRHLVPSIFLIYFITSLLFYQIFLLIYFIPLLLFSFINNKKISIKILNIISFAVMHISYGLGFIFGLKKIIWNGFYLIRL